MKTIDKIYHGINGNVSLNRRGELITNHNGRGDLTLGSDKSSSLSRSEGGVYDVVQAETQLLQNRYNQDGSIQSPTGTSTTTTTNTNYNNNNGHGLTNQFMNGGGGGGGGVGTTMTNHNQTSISLESNDSEMKKKKWPTDRAYFLAKEILMTERTYKKDLDILNNWFREELSPDDLEKLSTFFNQIDLLIQHHNVFLRDLEHRLLLWEGHGSHDAHRIGDVMLTNMVVLPIYEEYIENYQDILEQLHELFEHDERFQQIFRDFEQQKICYIPIGYLMLKPFYRLLHYQLILEMLLDHYTENHIDRTDCQGALVMLSRLNETVRSVLPDAENYQLLSELQRDLDGFDCLVQNDRKLIRQGCLLKHSKRGLQQRMFFLFSDVLLYGSKSSVNQAFKILGHVPIRSLLTENAEHNTFVIFGGQRAITVSAGTTAEKTLWLAELGRATFEIKNKNHVQLSIGPLKNCSSSEEGLETCGINNNNNNLSSQMTNNVVGTTSKAPPSRSNTALHVCWHRGATVGLTDHLISAENQLSGYLLRKFKNSSGWQKLWVVFTSFCLYFYKNYQDECALASLPLLGYTVGPPGYQDSVQKEYVFKLSFKNHVYFFRAESEHTYNRWLDVLRSTTQTQDFKNITS